MKKIAKKLNRLWRRRQLDRDLEDEIQFHLEMKTEEVGNRAEAQHRLGNLTGFKEACRELWSFSHVESWWRDLRYALRSLVRAPGFSLVAVLALGVGIGADTAVFTIARGAFLWNLGLDHLDQIVFIGLAEAKSHQQFAISYSDFQELRAHTKSLAGLAAYQFFPVNLSDSRTLPDRYQCASMSANGFFVSEQQPLLGRGLAPGDEQAGAPPVVVLTYRVWLDRYGKDPSILGKTIRVNDVPHTVVGIFPPERRFPEDADLWTPLRPDGASNSRGVALVGRLPMGGSVAAVRTELTALAARLARLHPAAQADLVADVEPIAAITGAYSMRPLFAALWAAVGFVLLIACADVAIMLLAGGAGRAREVSIRIAIGAGRVHIIRQLLIESTLLAIAGGLLGWLIAVGGLHWFDSGTGGVKPVWLHLTLDTSAFAYLAFISAGTGILFGLVPALRLARVDVHTFIKDGGHGVAGARRTISLANSLVVAEMALCIVLLAAAGLMIRSAMNLYGAPLGVDTKDVLTMHVNLPEAKYPLPTDQVGFYRNLQPFLRSLAGVESTAIVSHLPLGRWTTFNYQREGAVWEPDHFPLAKTIIANPGYFDVMRIRPLRGRIFHANDGAARSFDVVVNQSLVSQLWRGENALGKRLRLVDNRIAQPWLTVVGVIPDILQNSRHPLEHDPLLYLPYSDQPQREMFVLSRTRIPPTSVADSFRHAVQRLDANLAVYDIHTLDYRLAQNRLSTQLMGSMFSVFACIALVLAALGLYAVMAHSISQRIQEIGVRMAIGGTHSDILRLVYKQAMRPIVTGLAVGLPLAFATTRVLGSALVGVAPGDPLTFSIAVLLLLTAGALGCAIPARRAVRVDPIVALRYE